MKSSNLSLNEAIDVAQNRPLWRLMSMFGAAHLSMPEMTMMVTLFIYLPIEGLTCEFVAV